MAWQLSVFVATHHYTEAVCAGVNRHAVRSSSQLHVDPYERGGHDAATDWAFEKVVGIYEAKRGQSSSNALHRSSKVPPSRRRIASILSHKVQQRGEQRHDDCSNRAREKVEQHLRFEQLARVHALCCDSNRLIFCACAESSMKGVDVRRSLRRQIDRRQY